MSERYRLCICTNTDNSVCVYDKTVIGYITTWTMWAERRKHSSDIYIGPATTHDGVAVPETPCLVITSEGHSADCAAFARIGSVDGSSVTLAGMDLSFLPKGVGYGAWWDWQE